MTRPNKLGTKDTRTFNLVMRSRTLDILSRKSDELTRLTQTQVSVADIIRLCVDMNMGQTCEEIERRYLAQR